MIANYAAAISIHENARNAGLESRQYYIGELCTAPIVCPLPPVVPRLSFFYLRKRERKEQK